MVKEATDEEVRKYLENDAIGRNRQLDTLMKFLNSLDESIVIGINDAWGTGKTVFVKQLKLMASQEPGLDNVSNIDKSVIEQFQNRFACYYFNAWEYDYMPDSLYALSLGIISQAGFVGKTKRSLCKLPRMISPSDVIKRLSGDFVNPDKAKDVVDLALSVLKIREDVQLFIEELKEESSNKKLIFIIDEIDRCKPSFAVDLLEIIKHYFQIDGVIFVIATNNSALSSTIKHYYGQDYNGGAYLERFFDFTIFLKRPDTKNYMKLIDASYQWQYVDAEIIDYYRLSMREIRHLYRLERMTDGFVSFQGCDGSDDVVQFAKYILLPIILVMIVVGDNNLSASMSGRGKEAVWRVVEQSPRCIARLTRMINLKNNSNIIKDKFGKLYSSLFGSSEIAEYFQEVLSILSGFTDIDKITAGDNNK